MSLSSPSQSIPTKYLNHSKEETLKSSYYLLPFAHRLNFPHCRHSIEHQGKGHLLRPFSSSFFLFLRNQPSSVATTSDPPSQKLPNTF
uniref:Uncharacterized protein n=1 Tax=Kalanchoe fedtschenkoi TaxID=63787 RepID=A0A7N0T2Q4_KALFE